MSRRATEPPRRPHIGTLTASRSLPGLGSDWLYLNLYLPSDRQDDFIRGTLPELVEQAGVHGVDRWFFIRYNDPEGPHLRVRFHGTPDGLWGAAAPVLGARLRDWQRSGILGRYRVDQYDAEIERYGGADAMAAAERVFEADSVAAMRFLELVRDPDCAHSLDAFATISLASLAAAFGVPPRESAAAGEWEDDAAAAWLSLTGSRIELPRSFRSDVQRWRELVDPYRHWPVLRADPWGAAALEALEQRDDRVRSLRAVLHGSHTPHQRLIGSLMHMTCNRLFGGDSARERAAVATARGAVQDNFNRRRHT
jgi:thiopeptide-type bacteriocin biosynthesis protein